MTTKDLVLNIAVNLGRLGRFSSENRPHRINQFIDDTQIYLDELKIAQRNPKFEPTYERFQSRFSHLKNNVKMNDEWAEEMYTWANILTHRAKLLE